MESDPLHPWFSLTGEIANLKLIAEFIAKFGAIGLGAALGFSINTFLQSFLVKRKEKVAFYAECDDLLRHLKENMDAIDKILSEKRKIRINHVRHLSLHSHTAKFSTDIYRALNALEVKRIYHLKITLRNLEIDINEAERIYREDSYGDFREYLLFLKFRIDRVREKIYCITRKQNAAKRKRIFAYR